MQKMIEKSHDAANFLKGLSNPHRLLILCQLVEGEKSVNDMIDATGIAQTSMSQHLNKLKQEDIVTFRRDHRTLYYRINCDTTLKIMNILHNKFCNDTN